MNLIVSALAAMVAVTAAGIAAAQDAAAPQSFAFEGGTLTIAESDEGDKVLAFDGKELARNFVLYYDKNVEVGGKQIALFDGGDGGNQCGTNTIIVWKPDNGAVQSAIAGDDCGSPAAAITEQSIYFVPFLLPGASKPAQIWTPTDGLKVAGTLAFTPQPGTDWKDLDPAKLYNVVDAFDNEAVYALGKQMLGDGITDFAMGLLVGGGTEKTPSGVFYASGCVPHACGGADAFMGIDPHARKLYFAQQGDQEPRVTTWPALTDWPADLKEAMQSAIGE
jgi:hypothetical protein